MDWLAFKTGGVNLAILIDKVQRAVEYRPPIAVPLMPTCHKGLVYERGEVFDLIHPAALFVAETAPVAEARLTRIILVKDRGLKMALQADEIIGLISTPTTEPAPACLEVAGRTLHVVDPWRLQSSLLDQSHHGFEQI